MSTASTLIEELEKDAKARKRLAKLLATEYALEPELRLALINAILKDVATKHDVEKLREEINKINARLSRLEGAYTELSKRVDDLINIIDKRITDLDKRIDALGKRINEFSKRLNLVTKITMILTGTIAASIITQIIISLIKP